MSPDSDVLSARCRMLLPSSFLSISTPAAGLVEACVHCMFMLCLEIPAWLCIAACALMPLSLVQTEIVCNEGGAASRGVHASVAGWHGCWMLGTLQQSGWGFRAKPAGRTYSMPSLRNTPGLQQSKSPLEPLETAAVWSLVPTMACRCRATHPGNHQAVT